MLKHMVRYEMVAPALSDGSLGPETLLAGERARYDRSLTAQPQDIVRRNTLSFRRNFHVCLQINPTHRNPRGTLV